MFYRYSCIECKQCRPRSDAVSAASDRGLHCLPMSLLWDTRHIMVKIRLANFDSFRAFSVLKYTALWKPTRGGWRGRV